MKVSEIKLVDICHHIRMDITYLTSEDESYLPVLQKAAVSFAASFTGLSESELDEHEDITVAVLALISDMYDNRQIHIDAGNLNQVASSILGLYRQNFL